MSSVKSYITGDASPWSSTKGTYWRDGGAPYHASGVFYLLTKIFGIAQMHLWRWIHTVRKNVTCSILYCQIKSSSLGSGYSYYNWDAMINFRRHVFPGHRNVYKRHKIHSAGYRDTATRQICTKGGKEGNMDLHVSLDPLNQTTSFGTSSHKWSSSNCPLALPERIWCELWKAE